VFPGIWRVTFGVPEHITPVSLRRFGPSSPALNRLSLAVEQPVSITGEVTRRGCTLRTPLVPGEMVYGLGLQLLSHRQRGKKTLRVNADPPADSGDTHAPVPFFVTTRGYGVFIDTARYAAFYIDHLRSKSESEKREAQKASVPIDDSKAKELGEVVVEIPNAAGVDVYVFSGPTMKEAVQRYNLFSGGGCLPPEWGLGFWYRAWGESTQDQVLALAKEFRERKIPCDVIGLEPGWQSHAYSCSFSWSGKFPDPALCVGELGEMGLKVNLWEHAFTHPTSPLYGPLREHSGSYTVFDGLVPDFAGPEARRIFGDYHKEKLIDGGIAGFKLDECDNSDFLGGWSFPELSHFPSGLDGEQMHSVFGLRYQDAILEAFHQAGKATYGLVRSSGALAAPYPFVLYSDLYDHRGFIRALTNSGFSGLLWCPEVRDATDSEDLIRRLQSVVFSPLAMINGWYVANPPWKQHDKGKNNRGEFASGWEELERQCREIIGWRMQLVPYLKAAFEHYATNGVPPFRALVMDYPDDTDLFNIDDQYLVGDRMLVAPFFAGDSSRKVILPKGKWCDFWTGESVDGGQTIVVKATLDKIPVYVKWGAVFPVGGIGACTQDPATRELTVRVYGDGSISFLLGDSSNPELHLAWNSNRAAGLGVQGSFSGRGYSIVRWQPMSV
jgi:alpha-D-xyloside xylohydrolase